MAIAGDSYRITLKEAHLSWGVKRYTNSRKIIYGEGYIPIPAEKARELKLYNSNSRINGLGYNQFNCISSDGLFKGILKSAGCAYKGEIHAKQFEGSGELKALGAWFAALSAEEGDQVEVSWISQSDIIIKLIKST